MVPAPSLPWETSEAVGKESWEGLLNAWMTWRLQVVLQNGWQMGFITCRLQRIDDGLCEEPGPCPGSSAVWRPVSDARHPSGWGSRDTPCHPKLGFQ